MNFCKDCKYMKLHFENLSKKFYEDLNSVQSLHPEWRKGQAVFNLMYLYYPDIIKDLVNTKYDPYYDDGKINLFLSKIKEKLKE